MNQTLIHSISTEKYIGIKYVVNGRDFNGIDCWGLVRLVYKEELGIDIPSFAEEGINPERTQELISQYKEGWEPTTDIQAGDVVIFKVMGVDSHIAVAVSSTHFLHARQGYDSAIESFASGKWKTRLVGAYKYSPKKSELLASPASKSVVLNGIPHPLRTERITTAIPAGTNVVQLEQWILKEYQIDDKLHPYVKVLVNGVPIPDAMKEVTIIQENDVVEYRVVAQGGGDILRTVLTVAVVLAAPYAASALAGTGILGSAALAGSVMGVSTFGISAATLALTAVGMALVNAIAPVRLPSMGSGGVDPGSAERQLIINGGANKGTQYGAIPFVLGKVRLTPPLGSSNYASFSDDGKESSLKMLLVWGYGPLVIDESTLKIGELGINKTGTYSVTSNVCTVTCNEHGLSTGVTFVQPTSGSMLSAEYTIENVTTNTFQFPVTTANTSGNCLVYTNFIGIVQETLDRVTEPTTEELTVFNNIYGKDVTQVPSNVELTCDGVAGSLPAPGPWLSASSTDGSVSSFNIAVHFPQGARRVISKGESAGQSAVAPVRLEIQYKAASALTWWSVTEVVAGNAFAKDAFTWVYKSNFTANEDVQVRIRRLTGTGTGVANDENNQWLFTSVLLHTTFFRNDAPAIDPVGCKIAKTAFQIRASDQLNGNIEGVNAVVQTYCKAWNGTAWVDAATSNPAALFRYVLEHPANPRRVTDVDNKINLSAIQYWSEYCNTKGFEYNGIVGAKRSVLDILRDICSAGRASPAMVDGKWTVIIDEPKTNVVQHFTPHNSWGFEGAKALPEIPDGLRVNYYDQDQDYQEAEVIVYNVGKDISNAELFESITLPGVTKKSSAIDHAKWHMAQAKLRPERYTLNTDIEYIVCNRGDRVKVMHDVPMWGLGSGRIRDRISSKVFEIDEPVYIDPTKSYSMRIRSTDKTTLNANSGTLIRSIEDTFAITQLQRVSNVVTVTVSEQHPFSIGDILTVDSSVAAVDTTTATVTAITSTTFSYAINGGDITLQAATGTAVLNSGYYHRVAFTATTTSTEVDAFDLFLFGEVNVESQDLIVLGIEPTDNKSARITLTDYGVTDTYNIFNDYLTLSASAVFESQLSLPPMENTNTMTALDRPTVTNIYSGLAAADRISPGVWQYNIKVAYVNPTTLPSNIESIECQFDLSSSTSESSIRNIIVPYKQGYITIPNVQEGLTYKVRLRYINDKSVGGLWTLWQTHSATGFTDSSQAELVLDVDRATRYLNITPAVVGNYLPENFKVYEVRVYKNSGTGDFWNVVDADIKTAYTSGTASFNLRDFPIPRLSVPGIKYRIACRMLDSSNNYISTAALADVVLTNLI